MTTSVGRVGMVARWKPVHRGHAAVLGALCRSSDRLTIGIGSANQYDLRNPFTPGETAEMLRLVLGGQANTTLLEVPDLGDGPRWARSVAERFGALDLFVTANPYVARLMEPFYPLCHPVELLRSEEKVPIDGARVRREMAMGDGWQELVPDIVRRYLLDHRLDERFRREFGLATLARQQPPGD